MTEERNSAVAALSGVAPSRPPAAGQVGVEVEFTGLGVRQAGEVLARAFGGDLREEDPQAVHLTGSSLGALSIELDVRHAHPHRGAGNPLGALPAPMIVALGHALAPMVPRELIFSPLDRSVLSRADDAIAALREAGATGDGATLLDSLGLHFNIGHAHDDPVQILALFKAFLLRERALRRANGDDWRIRAHAPPAFSPDYVARVLAPDYWPDLPAFTRDYLHWNPTRKRSLDLLPLLLHHRSDSAPLRFRGKVKPRAAFHYRLPVARVGRPGWTIQADWARWLEVEGAAAEIARTRDLR